MKIYLFHGSENKKGKTAHFVDLFTKKTIKSGHIIVKSIESADALFVISPVHWFGAPIKLKKFIDGKLHKMEENDFKCEGKFFGALIYAPEGGAALLLSQLALTTNLMGFKIPPYSLTYYRCLEDKWSLDFDFLEQVKLPNLIKP